MSDDVDDSVAGHEFGYDVLKKFFSSLKYIFLPVPKENNVEKWTREGFPYVLKHFCHLG